MTEQTIDSKTFTAMQTTAPIATYKKKILGKVNVMILNSFTHKPESIILSGDPDVGDESCYHDVWSEQEDVYFTRTNKKLFDIGMIIKENRKSIENVEKKMEQYSDDELKDVVNMKYASLQKVLSETDSVALVNRMLVLARDMEKSEKIIRAIEAKLSELQK